MLRRPRGLKSPFADYCLELLMSPSKRMNSTVPEKATANRSPVATTRKSILVIEDQPVMRQKTVTILKMEGYDVLEAPNGAIGIQIAHDELPDLILCDIMMPERDGYEVLQAIRLNRATAT